MTDHHENNNEISPDNQESEEKPERFSELAELEDKIRRRLRSNERFLERFLDEDFDDLDDDEDSDIIIDDERVSRKHCQIVLRNNKYHLVDQNSRNGTYLNGERVGTIPRLLQSQDEITLGETGKVVWCKIMFQHVNNSKH